MKLSVITINYNNKQGLQKTIESIVQQTFSDFEYIIIDGGSTDGSIDIIKDNSDCITSWVSEKDNGVYNAMNKGIELAKGEYLLMMNSGDYLSENKILEQVFVNYDATADLIYGNVYRAKNDKIINTSIFPEKLSLQYFTTNTISHQAVFIKKQLHDIIGKYDENLRFSSDWKFLILAIGKYHASFKHVPMLMTVADNDGLTSKSYNFREIYSERIQVLKKYFPELAKEFEHLKKKRMTIGRTLYLRLKYKMRDISGALKNIAGFNKFLYL